MASIKELRELAPAEAREAYQADCRDFAWSVIDNALEEVEYTGGEDGHLAVVGILVSVQTQGVKLASIDLFQKHLNLVAQDTQYATNGYLAAYVVAEWSQHPDAFLDEGHALAPYTHTTFTEIAKRYAYPSLLADIRTHLNQICMNERDADGFFYGRNDRERATETLKTTAELDHTIEVHQACEVMQGF